MTLSNDNKKHLRGIGHRLKPVVTVAGKGLTDNVVAEIDRALSDHELIKIKLVIGQRQQKADIVRRIVEDLGAQPIQEIGHIVLLYRKAAKPDPRLSNLLRH